MIEQNLVPKIFTHFWDIAIFVLEYFILTHPVDSAALLYCSLQLIHKVKERKKSVTIIL